jgi:hypothetical protein
VNDAATSSVALAPGGASGAGEALADIRFVEPQQAKALLNLLLIEEALTMGPTCSARTAYPSTRRSFVQRPVRWAA